MGLSEETKSIIAEAVNAAKEELENYQDIPEHYSVIMKHPGIDAKGYYSEIDMDIAARLKKCDTYAQRKTIYEQAMYHHVRGEIETKAEGLKKQVQEISKQHRVLTRAARLCKDPEAQKVILDRANALKESEAVKDYNLLLTGLECYAGINPKMDGKTVAAFNSIGYVTSGNIHYEGFNGYGIIHERPEQIKIEFRNMDEYLEQFKLSHPGAKKKTQKELDDLSPSYELFEKSVMQYGKDALEDTLNSSFDNMDERLDFIMINGQTLRERIMENDKMEGRKPEEKHTLEELNDISCNILTAALKSGARVEAFMLQGENVGGKRFFEEPVPIVATPPEERVTMTFWERFIAFFGLHKDKEKVEKFNEQQEMDRKMDECKKRVRDKIEKDNASRKIPIIFTEPITKEKKERLKITREIAKENCDNFIRDVRVMERTEGIKENLTYSFFPEEEKERRAVSITGKVDTLERDKPLYICVTMMMKKGIPLEEVLDLTKHKELRMEIGRELKEKFPTMTGEEYDALHLDGLRLLGNAMDEYAKKMSSDIKSFTDIQNKFAELYVGTMCLQVLGMDNFINKEKAIADCGGKENFDTLIHKAEEMSNIYSIKNKQKTILQKYYQVLTDEGVNIGEVMMDNMQKVGILQGLKSPNPTFAPQIESGDILMYTSFVNDHPQVIKLQEKANNLDREFLNDLLNSGGEQHAHMELEIFEERKVNLTSIGSWEANSMPFKVNMVINGEGIAKFDVPEKQISKQEETEIEEEISL